MNFSSLLIVTYGRTGSTLLMGVLNSIPGVLIRGENMNLCLGLYAAYQSLVKAKSKGGNSEDSTQPFFGAAHLEEKKFLADARSLLRRQLVPETVDPPVCWGFKEIRYVENAIRAAAGVTLGGYLDFLVELMPTPGFIFLTRDSAQVADSGFWKNCQQTYVKETTGSFERQGREWSSGRRDTFWLDYSSLTLGVPGLADLFRFIGVEVDVDRVSKVLSREHSYAGKADNLKSATRHTPTIRP